MLEIVVSFICSCINVEWLYRAKWSWNHKKEMKNEQMFAFCRVCSISILFSSFLLVAAQTVRIMCESSKETKFHLEKCIFFSQIGWNHMVSYLVWALSSEIAFFSISFLFLLSFTLWIFLSVDRNCVRLYLCMLLWRSLSRRMLELKCKAEKLEEPFSTTVNSLFKRIRHGREAINRFECI